ncbi:sensor domain-containing diguanylate cyclase [Pseudoalteromonas carrageenovora]|uniref:sensor domain-containing diguanylate cyclase n=1 Tax=Pseudoalteromonas carrageenovora TaxID=227 RepID=UPI0026E24B6B|nr:diguanylate cyclase [Pseudoalteromonas carrageenovora]MDO6546850.1 diguanylate cyclase [Pseudoalteromonas carrageenovora]MDO6831299.1 diguanylate cyclase [Pseudoalteromonas carrageenovora]
MNYAYQVSKIESFVVHYTAKPDFQISDVLANPKHEFKQSAYHLFYELIKLKKVHVYQEPNPVNELFGLIRKSLYLSEQTQSLLLQTVEGWWLEWYFALIMEQKINSDKGDMPSSYLSQNILNPMRKHELSHYAKLFTKLPMPICNVCANTGDILKVNQRFVDVFGYSVKEVPNLKAWWKKAYPDPQYREFVKKLWQESLDVAQENNNDIPANNYKVSCSDGSQILMEVSGINIGEEFIAVFNDATERMEAEDILRDMAFLDSLTRIANRRRFDEKLVQEFDCARDRNGALSIILIDIDYFKQFNDRYGHMAGDTCLYDVAQEIASTVSRPQDFVARYGGEEFVVLLPQTDRQGALFIAEQIEKAIESLAIVHEDSYSGLLSLSMGINTIDDNDTEDRFSFVKGADNALYYAKRQGRNCIALAKSETS